MRHLASYGPASLSRAVGVACTVSLHIIIARSVGPEQYAAVAFFVTVFSLAGLVMDFGNEQQLIREGAHSSPRARAVLFFAPLFALLLITALLLSARVLESAFSISGLPSMFFWGAPALLLWALQILPRSEMQRMQRFRSIAGIEAAGSVIAWLVAVVLFLRSEDPAYYGLYTLLMYSVRTTLYWLRAGIRISQVQGAAEIRKYFGSWKLLATSAGNRLTTTYDDFVVAASFGASMLGVYHLSYRVITLMQDFIAGVLRTLSYPVYASHAGETAAVYRQFCLDSKLVFAVTAPLLTLMMLTADWSIPLILTDQWSGAVLIFQLLALEALRQSMLPLAGQALVAMGKEAVLLRFSLVSMVVLLPVFMLLGLFDLTTFVIGFVIINSFLNVYYYREVRRAFAQPPLPLLFAWLPGIAASLLLVIAGLLLRLSGVSGTAYVALLMAAALIFAIYLYRFHFTDVGRALAYLRRRSATSAEPDRAESVFIHTDAAFSEDNPHLKGVHEELQRLYPSFHVAALHYRRDVVSAWQRLAKRSRSGRETHIVHIHFHVLCYQSPSLPGSVLRGMKHLVMLQSMRLAGMRLVVSLHDDGAHDFPHRSWEAIFLSLLLQAADTAVTYSARGHALLSTKYGRLLDNAILPHAMYAVDTPQREGNAIRTELDIGPDRTVLLLLGTRKPYKGFDDVVDALRDVESDDITLLCAGKGMRVLAEKCGEIGIDCRLRDGWLSEDEIAECIAAADYGLLPYRRILHSGTAMLFLSHGCPIIAPRLGVFPEYIDAFDIGISYDSGVGGGLRAALKAARTRSRESYREGIRRFAGDHAIDTAARMLSDVYLRTASGTLSGQDVSLEQSIPTQRSGES